MGTWRPARHLAAGVGAACLALACRVEAQPDAPVTPEPAPPAADDRQPPSGSTAREEPPPSGAAAGDEHATSEPVRAGGEAEQGDEATADEVDAPVPAAPIDVVIEGEKPETPSRGAGQQHFKRREIERVPGAFGDPFRVIEVMPGVVPMVTGLPHFVARGALPSSAGYFIDGIRVPFLFHLGVGPSVINPAMVQGMDFYPGPYPAALGRHVGGVVAAQTRPPYPRIRAEASIRVFDAGAFVEVPFLDGDASAFAGGRYSYTAAALALFAPETRLSYWDYQAGGGYWLSPRDRLSLMAFGSDDYLGEIEADETEKELFGAQFHRLHLQFDHGPLQPSAAGAAYRREQRLEPRTRAGATLGYDRTGLGEEGVMEVYGFGLRVDGEFPVARMLRLRVGSDLQLDEHEFERLGEPEPEPEPEDEEPPEEEFQFDLGETFSVGRTTAFGGYVDVVFRPVDELEIVPGIRSEVFTEDGLGKAGVDPRATVSVHPLDWLTTVSGFGLAHQRPALLLAVPGLDPQALDGGLQEAVHLSQGVEFALPERVHAGVTVFHHWYSNMTDFTATCAVGIRACSIGDRADGRAYGVEAMIRRSLTEQIGGLVAYTLSRAERTARGETTLADFDRTHVFHLVLGVDLGRGWHAGSRLTVYSGRPYSKVAFDDPAEPEKPTLIGKRNALRRPAFYRVDVRLEKRWHIGETGWVSLVLEGMNVTLSKEIVDFDCRIQEVIGGRAGLSCGGQEIGPITIPSIGVSGGF